MKYVVKSQLRVLYFDLECKPGHWIGGDYVSKVVTACAWAVNKGPVQVETHYDSTVYEMALTIAAEIFAADLVVGHYIRGFDLPLLNGALLQAGLPPLGDVMTQDTKLDLVKNHGRSQSQENLADQLGLKQKKLKVTLPEWEGFNGLEEWAKATGIKRVKDDVIQNRALRAELIERGWLGGPTLWTPKTAGKAYRP